MITFESMEHFVNHYKGKKTIPSTVDVTINGNVHSFTRRTVHNQDAIDKWQWDKYEFEEPFDLAVLGIKLRVNYFRLFGEKVLFEAYFEWDHLYGSRSIEKLICPIYFYDKFVTDEDYLYEGSVPVYSEPLYKWLAMKFTNPRLHTHDFLDLRLAAFDKLVKELHAKAIFQRKCKINDRNALKDIIPVPASWKDEFDDDDDDVILSVHHVEDTE
ncbi:hypothetical protein [Alicyclobacillus mengziensis]|uniref:Uncharacterized protein n=1 Tax=Alicyclobacillus mengziensis TaxID=2931921 RepID=A0A9X7W384_9BACL|nr:hypothetical protein [Alicyclobacillus mengziensis]QSO48473.1 hypothetical protein JZ786_05645 [Alicyclobacillus mengziensis]